MFSLKNLKKSFNQKKILDDISFDVQEGSIAILLGPSGAGKSTLLRILNNLESLDSGQLYFDNKKTTPEKLRKEHAIGMVFQHFNLFDHLTVEENIMIALEKVHKKTKEEAYKKAHELLKLFDLEDKAHQSVKNLSGGQKQRLAIVREMALDRKIICMDEPTSALDPGLTTQVAESIKILVQQGYCVIVATHDISFIQSLPGTLYLMEDGKIIEGVITKDFFEQKKQHPLISDFVQGKKKES